MATFDVVFSSGGTKGIAFIGAMDVLEGRGHRVGRVMGTSAGAIAAALAAAGYRAGELEKLALAGGGEDNPFAGFLAPPERGRLLEMVRRDDSETRALLLKALRLAVDKAFDRIVDKAPGAAVGLRVAFGLAKGELYDEAFAAFVDHALERGSPLYPLLSFLELGGFFSTAVFEEWLAGLLRRKAEGFEPGWTLARFHRQTGSDLTVVTADTTAKEALFLNHRTAPDCPVVQAVRMSMSIPLVWQEVAWQAGWGKYLGEARTGHFLVDGAAMLNLPIRYMAEPDDPDVRSVMGDPGEKRGLPLGLLLDDRLPVAGDVPPPAGPPSKVVERLGRLVETVTRWEDAVVRRYEEAVCRVPSFGYGALEFGQSEERVEVMINNGRCAMTDHLRARKL